MPYMTFEYTRSGLGPVIHDDRPPFRLSVSYWAPSDHYNARNGYLRFLCPFAFRRYLANGR